MLTTLLITNDPEVARFVVTHGVGRIMVDTEITGKAERQAGKNMILSDHTIEDVGRIRAAVPAADLLLRVNPFHAGTAEEIRRGAAQGANLVMLPMVRHPAEVAAAGLVAQECGIGLVPLVETAAAMTRFERIIGCPGVKEVYVGLNDLHLELGCDFLFEPVAGGLIDHLAGIARRAGIPWGFGGLATLGSGLVPGELVLAEHARLGSTRVILSRAFTRHAKTLADLRAAIDLPAEVAKVHAAWRNLTATSPAVLAERHRELQATVAQIVDTKRPTTEPPPC
jgi:hypothetical protein